MFMFHSHFTWFTVYIQWIYFIPNIRYPLLTIALVVLFRIQICNYFINDDKPTSIHRLKTFPLKPKAHSNDTNRTTTTHFGTHQFIWNGYGKWAIILIVWYAMCVRCEEKQ